MALSFVQYSGNGSQQTFAIPFPYLQRENIEVRVDLDVTPYTWDDDNTIRISPAPANGAVVEARRVTPREDRLVDFVDGSVLTESDLDLANLQTFYIVQEAIDIAGGTLELLANGSYGAGGRRIEELGNPVDDRDAVTKEWAETAMSSQLTAAIAAKTAAETARDAASGSQSAAAGSASAAAGSASTATSQAGAADSARAAAVSARDAALAYRDAALGFRNEAQGFRNEAETFRNQAAASAAAAATFDPSTYLAKGDNLASVASKPNARANLQVSRNYSGASQVANNAAPSTESGRFFNMDIAAGVNIFNLPAVAGIQDGHSVVVRATGTASYGATYVAAETGKTIAYRGREGRFFNLVGKGETFRFTWLAGLNIWLAECLVQPGPIGMKLLFSGSGVWSSSNTAVSPLFFNSTSGDTAAFSFSSTTTINVPAAGVYTMNFRVGFSGAAGSNVGGTGQLMTRNISGSPDAGKAWDYQTFTANEDTGILNINWTDVLFAGDQTGAFYATNAAGLYHYYDWNWGEVILVSR